MIDNAQQELIHKFLEKKLTADDEIQLKKEFAENKEFANELTLYAKIEMFFDALHYSKKKHKSQDVKINFFKRIKPYYSIAASVIFIVGLGFAYFFGKSILQKHSKETTYLLEQNKNQKELIRDFKHKNDSIIETKRIAIDSLTTKSKNEKLLYNQQIAELKVNYITRIKAYIPNINLENQSITKSNSKQNIIISPKLKTYFASGDTIKFNWHFDENIYELRIVDNFGLKIKPRPYKFDIKGDSVFVLVRNLKPGLYYWKLKSKTNLPQIGSFMIYQ